MVSSVRKRLEVLEATAVAAAPVEPVPVVLVGETITAADRAAAKRKYGESQVVFVRCVNARRRVHPS